MCVKKRSLEKSSCSLSTLLGSLSFGFGFLAGFWLHLYPCAFDDHPGHHHHSTMWVCAMCDQIALCTHRIQFEFCTKVHGRSLGRNSCIFIASGARGGDPARWYKIGLADLFSCPWLGFGPQWHQMTFPGRFVMS